MKCFGLGPLKDIDFDGAPSQLEADPGSWAGRTVVRTANKTSLSWPEFVSHLVNTPVSGWDPHWAPQHSHCLPCHLPYSAILHQASNTSNGFCSACTQICVLSVGLEAGR